MKTQTVVIEIPSDSRHELFMQIIGMLWGYNDAGLCELAEAANCHWTTLYKWKSGGTMTPRLDKIAAVALAMGYDIVLKKRGKPTLRMIK